MKHYIFQWSGINQRGEVISGLILSPNVEQVNVFLKKINIFKIHNIKKKPRLFFSKNFRNPSQLDIAIFFRQLSTLIHSGVPMLQSCEMLKHTQNNFLLKQLICHIEIDIASGRTFSEALKKYPEYVDELTSELIHVGIHSGTFPAMLNRIATYKEKKILLHKKIKQALFYPIIVCFIAIFVSAVMLIFVVPRFAELFHEMNKSLPFMTECVINISNWICHFGFILLLPLFAILLFWDILKNSIRVQTKLEYFYLKFSILQKIKLVHFIRNLMITLTAGIPILEALKFTALASNSLIYKKTAENLQNEIAQGHPLHYAMQETLRFPNLCVQMIKIGEESGSLEKMLEKMLELYESDIDLFVSNLGQILEPLIMVILGVLIGGLVIAMYLPIFKLGTAL